MQFQHKSFRQAKKITHAANMAKTLLLINFQPQMDMNSMLQTINCSPLSKAFYSIGACFIYLHETGYMQILVPAHDAKSTSR